MRLFRKNFQDFVTVHKHVKVIPKCFDEATFMTTIENFMTTSIDANLSTYLIFYRSVIV